MFYLAAQKAPLVPLRKGAFADRERSIVPRAILGRSASALQIRSLQYIE
jgi:hypothetical protein